LQLTECKPPLRVLHAPCYCNARSRRAGCQTTATKIQLQIEKGIMQNTN
jgi:hypothetical protein